MKPILVAIIAASVFLIPCDKENTTTPPVQDFETGADKSLPFKQVNSILLPQPEEMYNTMTDEEVFYHNDLFLPVF